MSEREEITAIVLAGGRSARFGGPKLEATIDGLTVLDRALLAVDQVATSIIVAGPAPVGLPPLAAPLLAVPDMEPFAGPLAALSGALALAGDGLAIVVGGDMPALVPEVLRLLLEGLRADALLDAAILESPADATVTAVLPVALRVSRAATAAVATIDGGDRSLVRFLARLACRSIPRGDWLPFDSEADTLLDVDTPADLIRLGGNEIR